MKQTRRVAVSLTNSSGRNSDSRGKSTKSRATQRATAERRSEPSGRLNVVQSEEQNASENEIVSEIPSEQTVHVQRTSKNKTYNSTFEIEELTSDDEIYTFQCPENHIKQTLCDLSIDFTNSKQSITQGDCLYELEFLKSSREDITMAFPSKTTRGSLTVLPLKGHIVLQKALDIHINDINFESDTSNNYIVDFPSDLKVRHPLLGEDWKAHIDLARKSTQKENFPRKTPRKSKKVMKDEEVLSPGNLKRKGSESEISDPPKRERLWD